MMDYTIITGEQTARLTSHHSRSSHGIAVLVVNGEAHGAADLVPDPEDPDSMVFAADVVAPWGRAPERTEEERDAAASFLRQWPTGPQLAG